MNLLFVCSRNRRRSPTAEAMFAGRNDHAALSAGTATDAETPLSLDLVAWADIIFVMEPIHRRRLQQQFAKFLRAKRIVSLGIQDSYAFMDPALIDLLWQRLARHVELVPPPG